MTRSMDVELPSGRLHVERTGPTGDVPTAMCVHGLTANVRSWDLLREDLAAAGVQVVAMDLRGRGRSEVTPSGTYGLAAHAEDLVALADFLGLERWHHVGWSMGALIGLGLAERAGKRLESMTLVDAVGPMDQAALDGVRAGTARLDAVVPDEATYFTAMQAPGIFAPWNGFWEAYFRWELAPAPGGLSATTDRAAVLEDLEGAAFDFTALWPALTMPTLLVRASDPVNGGLLVPADARDRFLAEVPTARVVEVPGNHWTLMLDPDGREAVVRHITG